MGKEIKVRLIMRWNSTDGWKALSGGDSTLAKGEIGLEYIPGNTLPKMKIGTGELSWDNLPYFETSLPKNFTWGKLRGTTLQTSSSKTENLELTKPGFLDTVNIVTLNKNFEKIDTEYYFHTQEMNSLGARITALAQSVEIPENTLSSEIIDARTRFSTSETYDTIGDTLRAIDRDLQQYKTFIDSKLSEFKMPTSLELNEEGKIYLIDKEGSQIGSAIEVKDTALETQVGTLSTNIQILDSKIKNNSMEIVDLKDKISKLPSTFPNNLIYEDNKLYLAVDDEIIENSMVEITGGGGSGGSETSYKIELTAAERNISKPLGEKIELIFTYRSYDKEDETINDGPGSGIVLVSDIQRKTFTVKQGENILDVTEYLAAGQNVLKIKVTNSEGSSKTLQFNIKLLSLSITSNFPNMSYQAQGILPISYTVTSEVEFTSHFVIRKQNAKVGENYYEEQEIFTETFSRGTTSTAYLSPLPSGSYTLKIFATAGDIISNTLTIGLIIYSLTDIDPLIAIVPNRTVYTQGEIISIPYIIYYPNNPTFSIKFSILDENLMEYYSEIITDLTSNPQELTAQRYPLGNITFKIEVINSGISSSVAVQVNESEIDLELFSDGLVFEFDPIGRTNQNSANQWSYTDRDEQEIVASFSNIDWGALDGWQVKKDNNGNIIEDQTMLRILPGGKMTIPFYPFKDEIANNNIGYTIEIEVATQNVTNYDSLILASFDDTEGVNRGLRVYSQSAELKSQNNVISAQFKEDERVRLTFTIEPVTLNKLIMIYINGVLCGIKKYEQDAFRHSKDCPIIIGAEDSGIDIYFIRAYKRVLNETQQLNNFCIDRPSFGEKISAKSRNDILNASAGGDLSKIITINSLKGSIPYIIMHCPKLPANKDQDKFKGMKMTFVDPSDPTRSFTAENCTFSVQGTSSAGYPVKNFKIKLDKNTGIKYTRNGQVDLDGFYFEGKEKSQPTKVFCLKADYASSESANNVMLVDFYNQTCPYRNVAQQYQIDNGMLETVRHGIHGEPIVLFWQNTDTNEIYFQGKYNFNDDKDAEEVFGYKGVLPKDKYNIECWEFTNNNMPLCLFKHNLTEGDNAWFSEVSNDKGEMVPAWSNSFERRFPEQEDDVVPDLTAFRRMVDWVASTNTIDVFNTPLLTPVYYRTLDKGYVEGKSYYEKNSTGSFIPFTIITQDTTFSYSSNIRINNNIMVPKIQSILQTEVRPIDLIFTKNEDSTWRLYYVEDNIEIELVANIDDLSTYGVAFDVSTDSDIGVIENFSIQFYKGNNWTSHLYEYHTHDTSSYRLAKFKNEFEDYFILEAMAYYYVFTETVLLMDNRAKNMFLVSYDVDLKPTKVGDEIIYKKQPAGTYGHWAPTPYDMDSALGINNEGELVYGYHLEDDGRDGTVFTGQASVLWNNFRDCFQSEIAEMYLRLRSQIGTTNGSMPFSYASLAAKMNNHQDAWPEIIWNIDQQIKYLQPFYNGTDHLAMAQGDKRAQRNFWLYNAFKYRDSKYSAGDALDNFILFRLNGPGEFNIVPYSNIYARVRFGNARDSKQRVFRNQTATFSTEGIASIYDLETYVYSADRISSIGDLSNFNIGLCNFAHATKLKEIILGSERPGYENNHLKNFRVGASSVLKEVNLSNCKALKMEINLEECPVLETFKAKGSGITGVIFAKGARLKTCYLPTSVSTLTLRDLNYLTESGLQVETKENEKYNFSNIRIENCPQVPFYDLIINSDNLRALRLTGLNWHTTLNSGEQNFRNFYNKVKNLININESGFEDPKNLPYISGKIYLEEEISVEFLDEINSNFPKLTIIVNNDPQYFLTFVDYKNEPICKYIAAENSTPLDPTKVSIPNYDTTPTQFLEMLNSKPGEDRVKNDEDPEEEIDTKFSFKKWTNLPEKVVESAIITPEYNEVYLVKFFNEDKTEKLFKDQWIKEGENVSDPLGETIPTKAPSAEYSYTYSGWSGSLLNITQPTNLNITFDKIKNKYDVRFFAGELELTEYRQKVEYNSSPNIPPTNEVHKYYKDPITGEYKYYEYFDHIGWDIYNYKLKNWVKYSTEADGTTIYNGGLGYKNGYRVSSEGFEKESYGTAHTGFIPVKAGDIIRISGMNFEHNEGHGSALNVFDSNFKNIGQFSMTSGEYGIFLQSAYRAYSRASVVQERTGVWRWIVPPTESGVSYIRISCNMYDKSKPADGSLLVITINEKIHVKVEDVNSNSGLIIKPLEYFTGPIDIHAIFSSGELIRDSWETIIEKCKNGNYKTEYPIGMQKRIKFIYNKKTYEGVVEIVGQDHDTLATSEDKTTASLSFLLKDIFITSSFRNNSSFEWYSEKENKTIVGPLAGGWTINNIYNNLKNITFVECEEGDKADFLNKNIKSVLKKTDFGPKNNYNQGADEYHPVEYLAERIWTPSATEMGVLDPTNKDEAAQQGTIYIWFTDNSSRVKRYKENQFAYWTRTWAKSDWRFYGVGSNGGYAYGGNSIGLRSYDTAGLIFGFCL